MVAGRNHLSDPTGAAGGPVRRSRQPDGADRGGGPIRTCVGCRRRAPQAELVRLVRGQDGSLLIGRTRPGRGAWLCRGRASCLDAAERRGALGRALRAPLRPGALAEVRAALLDAGRPAG